MKKKEIKEETPIKDEKNNDDIEEMVNEKKRNTKDLTEDINKAKKKLKEELENTKIFDPKKPIENKKEKEQKKCNKDLNIIGELDLICIGYYIYLLLFTKYADFNYLIPGCIVVFMVITFGISILVNKKIRNILNIVSLISIASFIAYVAYSLS